MDNPLVSVGMVLFIVLHVPLALAMKQSVALTVAHAIATACLGIWFACTGGLVRVACVLAYIAGAEVLWRMADAGAHIPWEFGKLATVGLCAISLIRAGRFQAFDMEMLYLYLLVPAALMTLLDPGGEDPKRLLSFNLSGPLALAACYSFYRGSAMTRGDILKTAVSGIAPILGLAAICNVATLAAMDLEFSNESNFATSGGFGPNQVSSALGFAVLLSLLVLSDNNARLWFRLPFAALSVFLLGQAALTFSRSGVYLALICSAIFASFMMRQARQHAMLLVLVLVGSGVAAVLVFPSIDRFTRGALSQRMSNVDSSGRDSIAKADVEIFLKHPVFGVGVGQGKAERAQYYRAANAHTEFSRMLSEHGLFGIAAFCLMLAMAWHSYRHAQDPRSKGLAAAMLLFSFLFMAVNGMRLVLPGFAFGFAAAFGTAGTGAGAGSRRRQPAARTSRRTKRLTRMQGQQGETQP